jgi:pentatricopeptide repeat protein
MGFVNGTGCSMQVEIFNEMEERGVPPDLCTFTTLIHGYCFEGRVKKALQCLTLCCTGV